MNIGFDAKRLFHNNTGLGNYARSLVRGLIDLQPSYRYTLFSPSIVRSEINDYFLAHPSCKTIVPPADVNPTWWRFMNMKQAVIDQKVDVFHGLSNEIPMGLHKHVKTVVTTHDLIFKAYPQTYPWIDRHIYDYKFKYACQNSHLIMATSEATKSEIVNHYRISEKKISVIYQACDAIYYQNTDSEISKEIRSQYSIPSDYMLYVGSVIERKNALRILEAMCLIPSKERLPLVIVGQGQLYKRKMIQFIKEKNLEKEVIWVSHLQDNALLKKLYQNARVFIYPSYAEGFGIPLVEAMLCKVPVITSNKSCMPEVTGNMAVYVDPNSAKELADKIIACTNSRVEIDLEKIKSFAMKTFDSKSLSQQLFTSYIS